MTYLFFRLLNAAEKECEFVKHGFCKVPAGIIRIQAILIFFEECIEDSKCARTKSVVPFTDTLIHLGCHKMKA